MAFVRVYYMRGHLRKCPPRRLTILLGLGGRMVYTVTTK